MSSMSGLSRTASDHDGEKYEDGREKHDRNERESKSE